MLDQLLATDSGALTADRVREVLGLVDEETVEAFLVALVRYDAVAGIELLDGMEELGRDLGAFAEQAIERLRVALVASLGRGDPVGLAAAGPEALGAAARRLASVDPRRPAPAGCGCSSSCCSSLLRKRGLTRASSPRSRSPEPRRRPRPPPLHRRRFGPAGSPGACERQTRRRARRPG